MKYWPERGKSGFLVWRYLLRRDDTEPEPWTREGKDRTRQLGLTMQVRVFEGQGSRNFQLTLWSLLSIMVGAGIEGAALFSASRPQTLQGFCLFQARLGIMILPLRRRVVSSWPAWATYIARPFWQNKIGVRPVALSRAFPFLKPVFYLQHHINQAGSGVQDQPS